MAMPMIPVLESMRRQYNALCALDDRISKCHHEMVYRWSEDNRGFVSQCTKCGKIQRAS